MDRHRRVRRIAALAALSAALAVSAIVPSLAAGQNVVGDVLKGLGVGGQGGPAPAAGVPGGSGYQPPLHGNNPHGQGTGASVDILPSNTLPLGGDTSSSTDGEEGEDIVLGRSRGEQNPDGSYHGKVTILSLFGTDVVPSVETGPGETESGALGPLEDLLEAICAGSGGDLCLAVLAADSETTNSGSKNSFNFLNLNVGGEEGLHVSVLESNGNIEGDSSCQTAHGDSSVVDVSGQRQTIVIVGQSSAESKACNNAPSSQENDSSFLVFGGEEFPEECVAGEESEFTDAFPFFAFVCNADDTNGQDEEVQQAPVPYGVREAFTLFLGLFAPNGDVFTRGVPGPPEEETAFLKLTAAASESHAVAPPRQTSPTTPGSGTVAGAVGGQPGAGPGGQDGENGPGPVSREAGPGTGELAFTGSDVLILGLIGAGLVMVGLTATRRTVRHRRPAA